MELLSQWSLQGEISFGFCRRLYQRRLFLIQTSQTYFYSGIAQHAILYLIVTSIYYFLVLLGGQFYTFQWDILLVETGFLTAFCFAPWRWHSSFKLNKNEVEGETIIPSSVGCWPLRFLLFKLMFMSGIVKIQSQCPTWQNLTALEYHFATQCVSECKDNYYDNPCGIERKSDSYFLWGRETDICSFLSLPV